MITLEEAAQVTGGEWLTQPLPPDTPLRGGAFDTRALGDASIFFALTGGGDGHDYLPALAGSAVRLAVVAREAPWGDYDGAVLRVAEPLLALGELARRVVERVRPTVVAVTGSYGKTTAKDVIAHVLAGARRVLKSPGSLNNEIGVPVTLLGLDGSQDTVVLEFSARKPGDIAYLGRIAPPDVAVLLAVGRAHVGVFGSLEAIWQTKAEIFTHLRPGGTAVVGAVQPRLGELAVASAPQAPPRVLSFGRDAGDFHAEDVAFDGDGRMRFTGVHGAARLPLRAGMAGPHGCEPVLAAWAVASALGLPDALVAERGGVEPDAKGRLRIVRGVGGGTVIDDCYNSSAETVVNLIETLNARGEGDKLLVLGPLGEPEDDLRDSAALIAPHLRPPLGACIVYDPQGSALFERLREAAAGVALRHESSQPALMAALRAHDAPGRIVGIKGARSAHMERFVQALLGVPVACERHPCLLLKYCTDCELLSGT